MRNTPNMKVENYRQKAHNFAPDLRHYGSDRQDGNNGVFAIPYKKGRYRSDLRVLVSDGGGWDHVSVSAANGRTPTWDEMSYVKELFFKDDEVAMQLHVAKKDHISYAHNCLHLWRPQNDEEAESKRCTKEIHGEDIPPAPGRWPIPLPPKYMVGPEK